MLTNTSFTELVGIQWPIVQAPMVGGYSSPEMVAIVSNLGGLGTLALGNLTPEQIKQQCNQTLSLTDKPFAINLFARQKQTIPSLNKNSEEIKALIPYYQQLEIDESVLFNQKIANLPDLNLQIDAILNTEVPIVTFTFDIPSPDIVEKLKQSGKIVIATATSTDEAKLVQNEGFDAVILQGSNAGGHRASFLTDGNGGPETQLLLKQTKQAVSIPIISSGGIMNGQQIVQHISNGADACQLGTAYLFTDEAKVESYYLEALLQHQVETCLSDSFTGKYARVLNNRFAKEMKPYRAASFPYQGQLTSSIRSKAADIGRYEYLPFWAGASYSLGRRQTAASLTKTLIDELKFSMSY
ncbi:MAG: nitronate monooxygenase [Piscirickettsiaceae bacterium]|nr:nitronate monooxygenase [Piscirickettsiaceae bacterium]